jgi:hypothetical protein
MKILFKINLGLLMILILSVAPSANADISQNVAVASTSRVSEVKATVNKPYIKLTSKSKTLRVGDSYIFKAKVYGSDKKIVWKVSDTKVAGIDSRGKMTAKKAGKVNVIAVSGKLSVSFTVIIRDGIFSTDKTKVDLYDQQIIYINAEKMDDEDTIYYKISNEDIISCKWGEWNGKAFPLLITPRENGSAKITVYSEKTTEKLVINVSVTDEPQGCDSKAKELTAKEIYQKCAPSTVEIQIKTSFGEALGSGFFIMSGVVVTNYHVIENATGIEVITNDNTVHEVKSILGYNKDYDIAILYIDAVTEHLTLMKDEIANGEVIYTLGSPQGLTGSISDGIVSTASRKYDGVHYIQITAPISAGNSGGPCVNEYGEVIGINTFYLSDSQNLNFAVNISQLKEINVDEPTAPDTFYADNKATFIEEDAEKSQNASTAQLIEDNSMVTGNLSYSNDIDIYHIKLSEAGEIMGICNSKNSPGFKDLNFVVYNSDFNKKMVGKVYSDDGDEFLGFQDSISEGDYYIAVFSNNNYLNEPLDYSFYIEY